MFHVKHRKNKKSKSTQILSVPRETFGLGAFFMVSRETCEEKMFEREDKKGTAH